MKKGLFIFLISIFVVLALAGENPVKADDLVPSDIITVTPALSPTELKEKITSSFLIEYLRQGGSIDLTNKDPNYDVDDFINNFADLITELVQPIDKFQVYYNPFDTGTRVNPTAMCYNGVKIFNDLLPSIQSDVEPTPTPNPDNTYLTQLNQINGTGFNNFFDSISILTSNYNYESMVVWDRSFSFYSPADNIYTPLFSNCSIFNIGDIYIRQLNDNDYVFNFNFPLIPNFAVANPGTGLFEYWCTQGNRINQFGTSNMVDYTYWGGWTNNAQNPQYATGSYRGTLMDCMNYLSYHFHNINIYVNDELWSAAYSNDHYSIGLGQGTFIEGTNTPVEYSYQIDIYIDYDDIIDRLDTLIENQNNISFPDFSDLIIDANGQPAIAIFDVTPQDNIDDWYVKNYGTLIPLFPVFVTYPVSVNDIANVATIGIVDVIPDDIIDIFGIALIGMLFVTFIHRLLE